MRVEYEGVVQQNLLRTWLYKAVNYKANYKQIIETSFLIINKFIMATKSVKSILLMGLFFFVSSMSFGQVLKFKTIEVATSQELEDGSWSEWSDAEKVSQSVVIDFEKATITIFSNPKDVYDIVEPEAEIKDEDGDQFFPYICEDDEGDSCRVLLSVLHSQGGRPMLTIEYGDVMILYNMTYDE